VEIERDKLMKSAKTCWLKLLFYDEYEKGIFRW